MSAHKVQITIDQDHYQTAPGATRGSHLFSFVNLEQGDQLLLEVPGEIDVPITAQDLIFIRGGEIFSIGSNSSHLPDNPIRREPITFQLNGKNFTPPGDEHSHAKISGEKLKNLLKEPDSDLWADLDGIADALVEDDDRIVLQLEEKFFTVKRENNEHFYDVTVTLMGVERQMRFPAEITVRDAIGRCLSHIEGDDISEFKMIDRTLGSDPLVDDVTLHAAGVRDGHCLYVARMHKIHVNTRPFEFEGTTISYDQVVRMAFPDGPFDIIYTVAYANLHGQDGTLASGQNTIVHEGMEFRVRKTNRS